MEFTCSNFGFKTEMTLVACYVWPPDVEDDVRHLIFLDSWTLRFLANPPRIENCQIYTKQRLIGQVVAMRHICRCR